MESGWDENHLCYIDATHGDMIKYVPRVDVVNGFISLTNQGIMVKTGNNGTSRIDILYPDERGKLQNQIGYDTKDKRNMIIKRTITVIVVVAIMLFLIMR